jgi:hypothetical protein|nr:hypothetical protein [Kofleriaceae bacterium]
MLKSDTKQFGPATFTTTKFAALRGMTLMGKVLRGMPSNANPSAGAASIISDPALVLELLANTFAIVERNGTPTRIDMTRAESVDLVFGDDSKSLMDLVGWVAGINFEGFTQGASPVASADSAPTA